MKKRDAGFSLIELLIVVAIILIISGIAIPNLLRSKIAANETSAVGSLRTLNTVCIMYMVTYGNYPQALANLGPGNPATTSAADLIDSVLASGIKAGYSFTYTPGTNDNSANVFSYAITAVPISPGTTGQRSFYTDESGVIRVSPSGSAGSSSTPIN